MARSAYPVYVARDDDDFDEQPQVEVEEEQAEWGGEYGHGGVYEAYDDEEDYEDDGWTAHSKPQPPTSDLADSHYLDPLALVNSWESALLDLKFMHPERFLPPTEAPRTLAQKQAKAPFWYGPPASEASTSKLPPPPPAVPVTLPQPTTYAPSEASIDVSAADYADPSSEQPKKRKRLTGSQKKARKQAKLQEGAAVQAKVEPEVFAEKDEVATADEPSRSAATAEPRNPAPHLPSPTPAAPSQPSPLAALFPPAHAPSSVGQAASRIPHPSSFSFLVPPMGKIPSSMPAPPGITPLTGEEPPLAPESPEGLLEAMLWSYYTAGYQTALYHAAVGVAKFKPDEPAGATETNGSHP
ncbi:hypothetical protein JCM8097_001589 [Rhodosporidiobolus ruineniae]